MATLWYFIAAFVLAMYVVLDGFDFGAGALHLLVAKNDRERRQVLAAIGPYWDGNEVWLLAGGGVLFLAFPKVLASGLSGFYLAVMLLLWTLILRGIAIEFRSHVQDAMWRSFWDGAFFVASALAPVLLGAALGNLLRGVPLDADGWFALPLFESFSPHGALGILDWYTVLVGVFALLALVHHGALFLAWKTDGDVRLRSRAIAGRLLPLVAVGWLAVSGATLSAVPDASLLAHKPSSWLAGLVAAVALGASAWARRQQRERAAFLASCTFVLSLLVGTASAIFPVMLRAAGDPARSLGSHNAAADARSLSLALYWWPAGLVLVAVYFTLLFYLHRGKAHAASEGEGY